MNSSAGVLPKPIRTLFLVLLSFPAARGAGKHCSLTVSHKEDASFVCFFHADVPGPSNGSIGIVISDVRGKEGNILECNVDTMKRSVQCRRKVNASLSFEVAGTIPNIQPSTYQCEMTDTSADKSSRCVMEYTESPYNITFVDATQSTITIRWTAGESGANSGTKSFRVRYRPSKSVFPAYRYEDVTPPNHTNFTITDLEPGTEYEVSVLVVNAQGEIGSDKNHYIHLWNTTSSDDTMQGTCTGAGNTATQDIATRAFAITAFIVTMAIVRYTN